MERLSLPLQCAVAVYLDLRSHARLGGVSRSWRTACREAASVCPVLDATQTRAGIRVFMSRVSWRTRVLRFGAYGMRVLPEPPEASLRLVELQCSADEYVEGVVPTWNTAARWIQACATTLETLTLSNSWGSDPCSRKCIAQLAGCKALRTLRFVDDALDAATLEAIAAAVPWVTHVEIVGGNRSGVRQLQGRMLPASVTSLRLEQPTFSSINGELAGRLRSLVVLCNAGWRGMVLNAIGDYYALDRAVTRRLEYLEFSEFAITGADMELAWFIDDLRGSRRKRSSGGTLPPLVVRCNLRTPVDNLDRDYPGLQPPPRLHEDNAGFVVAFEWRF